MELTPRAQAWIGQIWGPLAAEGQALVAQFSIEELGVIQRFLELATRLQETHAGRIRKLKPPPAPRAAASKPGASKPGASKPGASKRRRLND